MLEKRRSKSNPSLGLYKSRVEVFNQDDVKVMQMVSNGMVAVRDPDAAGG